MGYNKNKIPSSSFKDDRHSTGKNSTRPFLKESLKFFFIAFSVASRSLKSERRCDKSSGPLFSTSTAKAQTPQYHIKHF